MRRYPSKLLLFGEYILLLGARALATPVPAFSGQWTWPESGKTGSTGQSLHAFAHSAELSRLPDLDTGLFQKEVAAGLYFQSNIPVGYGLGSSGALCAAVYDRYARTKTTDLSELKTLFAGMESYFHGQSSGIDPLTSYLNRALWITNRTEVLFFNPPVWQENQPVVFLLDTGLPRQTGPLVNWFLEQNRTAAFARRLEQELLPAHAALLEAWENGRPDKFWDALSRVSAFQIKHMTPMVPERLHPLWNACLAGEGLFLKICGAGGGGFMLGFAQDKNRALEQFHAYSLIFPFEDHAVVEK